MRGCREPEHGRAALVRGCLAGLEGLAVYSLRKRLGCLVARHAPPRAFIAIASCLACQHVLDGATCSGTEVCFSLQAWCSSLCYCIAHVDVCQSHHSGRVVETYCCDRGAALLLCCAVMGPSWFVLVQLCTVKKTAAAASSL